MPENRYLSAFLQIEDAGKNTISIYEDGSSRFYTLVREIGGDQMSLSDYAKVQEMFYQRYAQKAHNKDEETRRALSKAQMYCLLQMQMLMAARKDKSLRRFYPLLDFDAPVDPGIAGFISRKRPFYTFLSQKIQNRLMIGICLAACILLALLCLLFQMNYWLALCLTIVVSAFMLWYGSHKIVPMLIQDRMRKLTSKLTPVHREFELKMNRQSAAAETSAR